MPEDDADVHEEFEEAMPDATPGKYTIPAMVGFLPRSKKPDPSFVPQHKQDSVYPPL